MRIIDQTKWPGEILELSDEADLEALQSNMPRGCENLTHEELRRAFEGMSQKDAQRLIRKFNLDNKGFRENKQIAEDGGTTKKTVGYHVRGALLALRNRIWTMREVPDNVKFKSTKEVLEKLFANKA
ncbi:MAG TPA: hypothetical protein VLE47_03805 [Candidatus Saccharimonadales bacterium]|nr:hypothetical protein [Candidatus Saccharimonadales bacterium]